MGCTTLKRSVTAKHQTLADRHFKSPITGDGVTQHQHASTSFSGHNFLDLRPRYTEGLNTTSLEWVLRFASRLDALGVQRRFALTGQARTCLQVCVVLNSLFTLHTSCSPHRFREDKPIAHIVSWLAVKYSRYRPGNDGGVALLTLFDTFFPAYVVLLGMPFYLSFRERLEALASMPSVRPSAPSQAWAASPDPPFSQVSSRPRLTCQRWRLQQRPLHSILR